MSVVGLGTDIVEIQRLVRSDSTALQRLAKKVLTANEMKQFNQQTKPERFLAKRFAAKEAAVKALGSGIGNGVSWQHIEISNNAMGKPMISLSDQALSLAKAMGANKFLVTIADEQNYAVATVILST